MLYVPAVDWCNYIKLRDSVKLEVGGEFFAGDAELDSLMQGGGWLTAVEACTGKVRRRHRSASPMVAAVTTTSSGVLFTGDADGDFLAMDAGSGRMLYRFQTGGAVSGGVVTYAAAVSADHHGGDPGYGARGSDPIGEPAPVVVPAPGQLAHMLPCT